MRRTSTVTIMATLDERFGDLLDLLDEEQRRGIINILASGEHEGMTPDRTFVRNLVDYSRGVIDHDEYRRRGHEWARNRA